MVLCIAGCAPHPTMDLLEMDYDSILETNLSLLIKKNTGIGENV